MPRYPLHGQDDDVPDPTLNWRDQCRLGPPGLGGLSMYPLVGFAGVGLSPGLGCPDGLEVLPGAAPAVPDGVPAPCPPGPVPWAPPLELLPAGAPPAGEPPAEPAV